ncbi:STAS domain-containing protein [Kitasatospora sp. NBC_01539]|uniref:STAS domain-containing protein n=1 Tax=Kitasatospora sp. NBC_01539 TaxID=2903577 RepID=UPI0038600D83
MAQFTTRQQDGASIVDVKGAIVIGVGDVQLREAVRELLSDGKKKIVLNLADVTRIDSSGIGELVSAFTTTSREGGKLKLTNLPPKVYDLLVITQLITVFEVFDSEDEAVASFG